ncbi:MAG: HNH endonuclease [Mesorhizobium sp.]|uniref:HNH endonuclease n=1 Tax=Mesorhizobium sp. TaxID=1871066 RepID=UPI0012166615|nr:HNH endonuclease signature motif containing protein [Mesorhizobium sp.]TIP70327.1 MAG: HNH endonuclease [Mesorhizobium sp.]TIQ06724.1 MAG: HNH endonuclease [Mesorhizobium sp.]TIR48635.1 MAG: HNH endonuclease [Mesorhizobium sp.]TJV94676.1 MAG: HNH endonuclease [Mesorhizobium sp.]
MPRAVVEWIGRTDNTKAPPRVCQRVFDRDKGICHFCGQQIQPGQAVETDHIIALINGGENREANLAPIHKKPCHTIKTAADVADKAKVAAVRKKHIGITKPAGKLSGPAFPKSSKPDRESKAMPPRRSLFSPVDNGDIGHG